MLDCKPGWPHGARLKDLKAWRAVRRALVARIGNHGAISLSGRDIGATLGLPGCQGASGQAPYCPTAQAEAEHPIPSSVAHLVASLIEGVALVRG